MLEAICAGAFACQAACGRRKASSIIDLFSSFLGNMKCKETKVKTEKRLSSFSLGRKIEQVSITNLLKV